MNEEAKLTGLQDASDAQNDFDAISRLAEDAYQNATNKGFHDGEVPGDERSRSIERIAMYIANEHGECSELWESARKGRLFDPCDKTPELSNAEEELADIIIRAMDTAHGFGINIGRAVMLKMAYNRTRPYKHGKKA